MREPSFLGLRENKASGDVRGNETVPPPSNGNQSNAAADEGNRHAVADVLEQLERPDQKFILRVEGLKIPLNNLDKEFWPAIEQRRALTKRDLLVYFAKVSPYLLPHMRDRPITLTRYPNGIYGGPFFQKRFESKMAEFGPTVKLYFLDKGGAFGY